MFFGILGRRRKRTERTPRIEPLEARRLLSAATIISPDLQISPTYWHHGGGGGGAPSSVYVPAQGYTPSQVAVAYGTNQLSFSGTAANGAGTTIAIVDAFSDPAISSDLQTFDAHFNLPSPPSFQQVSQSGGPTDSLQTDPGWAMETSLDVEWAHATAPGASILLVESNTDSLNSLLTAVNYARSAPHVGVVSMSWGGSEFANETSFDSDFTTPPGHRGVTFVAASGDDGSWNGPEWPASSANVLSVGGTTLLASNSTGTYNSEAGWSGSGGGLSNYVSEPEYQESVQGTGTRTTPDVAFDADPNTGFAVYDSLAFAGGQGWEVIGGTSAGAPQWSGLIAIADQGRSMAKSGSLDGATGTLPVLYSLYANSTYSADYHDITAGSTSYFAHAQAGYDLVTGLGTPDAAELIPTLVAANTHGSFSGLARLAPPPAAKPKQPAQTIAKRAPTVEQPVSTEPISAATTPPPAALTSLAIPGNVAVAPAVTVALVHASSAASRGGHVTATSLISSGQPASRAAAIQTDLGQWLDAQTHANQNESFASRSVTLLKTELYDAIRIRGPIEAEVAPHVLLELAKLDASIFADSLRAFAHETAAALGGAGSIRWARMIEITAGSLMADAILVGYWYRSRTRRKAKAGALVAPGGL
jgi:hypothetical protein